VDLGPVILNPTERDREAATTGACYERHSAQASHKLQCRIGLIPNARLVRRYNQVEEKITARATEK
jgi:hypothetical protein